MESVMASARHWQALSLFLVLGVAAVSGAAERECPKGLEPVGEFRLFFGLSDSRGRTVSDEEWQRFVADTITPRFRAGLTVLEGRGQWLEPGGNLQREPVRVVMGAIAAGTGRGMEMVDDISASFQTRFGQDTVFRIWSRDCPGRYPG